VISPPPCFLSWVIRGRRRFGYAVALEPRSPSAYRKILRNHPWACFVFNLVNHELGASMLLVDPAIAYADTAPMAALDLNGNREIRDQLARITLVLL